MPDEIARLLDELANLQAKLSIIQDDCRLAIAAAVPQTWLTIIDDINHEHEGRTDQTNADIEALDSLIREMVLESGETVTSEYKVATWSRRVSWNDKGLMGFVKGHPEYGLDTFRNEGQPYVTIKDKRRG